ncbi:hypothetical protein P3X46_000618 [Hevea brasiliensis]|uniref:Uncharacterized protein n=1 Tax=Hevea brasiliensis TaxID=3981 RepID=A0ABQ9ND04_HEVBR|nr:hypothetical protein P3X46_000618 [Hevea brasiliensis]
MAYGIISHKTQYDVKSFTEQLKYLFLYPSPIQILFSPLAPLSSSLPISATSFPSLPIGWNTSPISQSHPNSSIPIVEPPPAVAETKILPKDSPSETRKSSLDVLTVTKGLLAELSSRTRKRKSPNPEVLQKQKETLEGFFNMPLEAIQQANAYGNIEGIIHSLIQNSNDLREKTILEILLARVAEFRESIPMAMAIKETAEARIISLLGKATDLDARLEEREKKLSFLVTEFSRLSKEEEKLEAEIKFLITQKEEMLPQKKHVLADLEKTNDETSEDVEE